LTSTTACVFSSAVADRRRIVAELPAGKAINCDHFLQLLARFVGHQAYFSIDVSIDDSFRQRLYVSLSQAGISDGDTFMVLKMCVKTSVIQPNQTCAEIN